MSDGGGKSGMPGPLKAGLWIIGTLLLVGGIANWLHTWDQTGRDPGLLNSVADVANKTFFGDESFRPGRPSGKPQNVRGGGYGDGQSRARQPYSGGNNEQAHRDLPPGYREHPERIIRRGPITIIEGVARRNCSDGERVRNPFTGKASCRVRQYHD